MLSLLYYAEGAREIAIEIGIQYKIYTLISITYRS